MQKPGYGISKGKIWKCFPDTPSPAEQADVTEKLHNILVAGHWVGQNPKSVKSDTDQEQISAAIDTMPPFVQNARQSGGKAEEYVLEALYKLAILKQAAITKQNQHETHTSALPDHLLEPQGPQDKLITVFDGANVIGQFRLSQCTESGINTKPLAFNIMRKTLFELLVGEQCGYDSDQHQLVYFVKDSAGKREILTASSEAQFQCALLQMYKEDKIEFEMVNKATGISVV